MKEGLYYIYALISLSGEMHLTISYCEMPHSHRTTSAADIRALIRST